MGIEEPSIFASQTQRPLPNASAVLALGIISIVSCCCYGLPGVICSVIALVLYSKDARLYMANPEWYTASSYSNLKTGRICAIIGLIPSILFFLFAIIMMLTVGFGMLSNPQEFFNNI
ncbi:MAG: hypothetical protein KF746_02050 [Chitinophagaceae bacterium]|nr:hypothetical protein [Chitinophagaceae bacterium]